MIIHVSPTPQLDPLWYPQVTFQQQGPFTALHFGDGNKSNYKTIFKQVLVNCRHFTRDANYRPSGDPGKWRLPFAIYLKTKVFDCKQQLVQKASRRAFCLPVKPPLCASIGAAKSCLTVLVNRRVRMNLIRLGRFPIYAVSDFAIKRNRQICYEIPFFRKTIGFVQIR